MRSLKELNFAFIILVKILDGYNAYHSLLNILGTGLYSLSTVFGIIRLMWKFNEEELYTFGLAYIFCTIFSVVEFVIIYFSTFINGEIKRTARLVHFYANEEVNSLVNFLKVCNMFQRGL